jgi:two-component system, chemotaxis family, chemotaxis protein CheY
MEKTILIVEDSPTIRKFITIAIKVLGHKVITAEDGMQALEKMPLQKIDLLITDLNMPNIDGYQLIKEVRGNEIYKDLPIIVLSSLAKDEDVKKGLDAGANAYLIKPFNQRRIQYEVIKYIG